MYIQQLYTGCLSEAAYYIESNGEAAVIDPLRDIETYMKLAADRNATIKYIFETHFHADFVSGHIDLAKASGAPIVYGPQTQTSYPVQVATDGQEFQLGAVRIKTLHTPGHTLESTCWLLIDEAGKDHALFSGDTLFIGDVGRPDLSSGNLGSEELASMLYDSLQSKILPLADEVLLYPAHGPGSSCGKSLGPETHSTLGAQKATNYALRAGSREEFIKAVTEGLNEAPRYFAINARINQQGYSSIDEVLKKGLTALSVADFKAKIADEKTVVLDTRHANTFTEGFIPGSIGIGLEGRFAEWAGSLLSFEVPLVLVTEVGKEEETVTRLARVGFENIEGCLKGGFKAWQIAGEKIDMIISVEADELAMDIPHDDKLSIIDVRNESEFAEGHVVEAVNVPLKDMIDPGYIAMLPEDANLYIHCASGYRSVIASSLIKRQGLHNLRNVLGGFKAIKEQKGIKTEKDQTVLN